MTRHAGVMLGMLFLAHVAAAEFTQQGAKLVGTGGIGPVEGTGSSVTISADGNTAIIGGPNDNGFIGAAWVFTRSGGVWTQQGDKLVGTGAIEAPNYYGVYQGSSVAISADGNTAILGGPGDNSNAGAAWVFTRSGGVWSQQGSKLVGTGVGLGGAKQGNSVAISADGNIAIVGGPGDNETSGAAWVFTRSGGVWTQQGSKLVGSGIAGGAADQGTSVAISGDGNTAIIGGPYDNLFTGAAWIFTRSGGVWTQQGDKLVGTGAVADAPQGRSVAISADGNTAIVGGYFETSPNPGVGAAWVYTRSGGVWSQQGSTLVGTGASGPAQQGQSVAMSADGNIAIVGGPGDSPAGAAWMYTRTAGVWSQQGNKVVGTGTVNAVQQGTSVAISADGNTAIVGGPGDGSNDGGAWVFVANGCAVPSVVVGQPQSQSIQSGQPATLSVAASGMTPLYYQWYQGLSGDTSKPVGTNSSSFTTPALTSATGYWVRVFNACGTSDSATAVITLGGCVSSSITSQPQSQSVQTGQAATLSVTVAGTAPLYYQWYQGSSGDTSNPVGTNASSFTTPPLTSATSYWVRVFNACGTSDSAAAIITVGGCTSPSITSQPQSQSVQTGQTATLSVTATGTAPFSYQWYQGVSGDASNPVGTNASSFTTSALTSTTSFWVRVSNSCGHADSAAATITLGSAFAYLTWVPVASHTSGLNNSQWRSDLGLLNTGSVTANVQIEFFGSSVVSSTTYVPPGVQSVLTDLVGQLGASGSGAIEILSDQALKVTTRTYNQVPSDASCYPNGTQGQNYPAVATSDGLGPGQSAYLAGLSEDASYRCNIGLVNTGTASATALVELYNGAGTKLGDYPVALAAGQWAQPTQPFLNVAHQTAMDRGYAKITVQSGSGVFAFASVIDNITNDPTLVTMQR